MIVINYVNTFTTQVSILMLVLGPRSKYTVIDVEIYLEMINSTRMQTTILSTKRSKTDGTWYIQAEAKF